MGISSLATRQRDCSNFHLTNAKRYFAVLSENYEFQDLQETFIKLQNA